MSNQRGVAMPSTSNWRSVMFRLRKDLINIDQKTLREIKYETEITIAAINKFLDLRNQQRYDIMKLNKKI